MRTIKNIVSDYNHILTQDLIEKAIHQNGPVDGQMEVLEDDDELYED